MDTPLNNLQPAATTGSRAATEAEARLAKLIVAALQLEMDPADIQPEAPLFASGPAGGLGLDSIDALELALAISREHGLELRSDDQRNHQIFTSLATLSAYVEAHSGQRAAPTAP